MESADERKKALEAWLISHFKQNPFMLEPLAGDASFRRYFRVRFPDHTRIAMDAPPRRENCRPFVLLARGLRQYQLQVPVIHAEDVAQGFLLLDDFGDTTFLKALNSQNADVLYHAALDALFTMHSCSDIPNYKLPLFTADFMQQEWLWHKEWLLDKLLHLKSTPALDACYTLLVQMAVSQPQVFMHRDYHSANLMLLTSQQDHVNKVGILDFQDAFIGPLTYDLASLLRDCYITWPEKNVYAWALSYLKRLHAAGKFLTVTDEEFIRWFDYMSLQRHLKALLTFARKYMRDNDSRYLQFIPPTLDYIIFVSANYPELLTLHHFYRDAVLPAFKQEMAACVL